MKTLVLIFIVVVNTTLAQNLTDFDGIKIENAADCKKAEPYALEASRYIFATPFEKNDINRLKSLQFIIKWMSATPDYKFSIDADATKLMKGNDDYLGLFMAGITKYVLENSTGPKDGKTVKVNSINTLLDYCEDPKNKMKMSKNLRKLSEARAAGRLEAELL